LPESVGIYGTLQQAIWPSANDRVARAPNASSYGMALLVNDNLTIDQVAQKVGYASRTSFLRAFRKVYKMEPPEYRGMRTRPAFSDLP
jgi:methylphosphotriester-DNA--protein-cysteine methyltransferase